MIAIHRRRRRRGQAGFTLIELMISLVLFSFAVAGVLAVAVSMVNGFREQRLAFLTEGAARSAMNYMADVLRGSSPGVPLGDISNTVQGISPFTCADSDGALKVVNNTGAPDELYAVFASGSVVTTSVTPYDSGDTAMDLIDGSEIGVGDTLLVTNYTKGHLLTVTGKPSVNQVQLASVTCSTGTSAFPTGDYPAGSVIVRAMRAHFYIADDGTLPTIPTLYMDPDAEGPLDGEPLAEGIEDMQIAIAIDQDGNGITDLGDTTDEWIYNAAGDAVPAAPLPVGTIRALRITLIARAAGQVTGVGTFFRPAAEDHAAGTVPDAYRRRVLTSVIEVRNLGGSP